MVDHLGGFHDSFSLLSVSLRFFVLPLLGRSCSGLSSSPYVTFSIYVSNFQDVFFPFQMLHLLKMKVFSYRFVGLL